MILTLKILFLFTGIAFACPVLIGGAFQKVHVHRGQVLMFAVGVVGFITLQWLI